jgi:Zn-finger nucleic acid-binding protein
MVGLPPKGDLKKFMAEKRIAISDKYEDIRVSLQAEVDREYQQSRYKKNEEKITFEQF